MVQNDFLQYRVFQRIAEASAALHQESYVIGGYVRDLLLQRPSNDIDVVTVGSGIDLARRVAENSGGAKITVYKSFGTAMIKVKEGSEWLELEFVGARKESYRTDSRNPVVEAGTLEDDLNRRDFTINALALSLNAASYGQLLDPFNGLSDLKNKLIRTPQDPDITYSDDPLRMIRAIRFASQLGFSIVTESFAAISRNVDRIHILSQERITDELMKIIRSPRPSVGFQLLMDSGLLQQILPEMVALSGTETKKGRSHKDNFSHTLEVLDNVAAASDNPWLRWAAVFHDIAKPVTKRWDENIGWTFHNHDYQGGQMLPSIFKRLRMPLGDELNYVKKLVLLHLRPQVLAESIVTDSAVRRLLFDAGNDVDDLMILCEADITSKNEKKKQRFLQNFALVRQKIVDVEANDRIRNWQPPVDGTIIMETFDLAPSVTVGVLKLAIREAILDGVIPNEFNAAYGFLLKKGEELNLPVVKNFLNAFDV
ncbi:MAG: HD domain-containing protein [Bacteroidia bacterium]|nr:HD domain-containing protein [Bacteroidales bacterium]MDY0286260.1 HD domain-containing protein [Bacteroidales bacterium]NCD41241.1 HD domain-containing protein [Bacteroidia bacterium]